MALIYKARRVERAGIECGSLWVTHTHVTSGVKLGSVLLGACVSPRVTTRHHVSTASPRDSRHSVQAHPLIPWDQRDDAIDQLRDRERQMTKFYCLIAAAAMFVPMVMATLNQAAMIVA